MAERGRRRIERRLAEAHLPAGNTLATFDFDSVPMVSKAQVMALASGDEWLGKGANILLFGPPGGGKSHPKNGSRSPSPACWEAVLQPGGVVRRRYAGAIRRGGARSRRPLSQDLTA